MGGGESPMREVRNYLRLVFESNENLGVKSPFSAREKSRAIYVKFKEIRLEFYSELFADFLKKRVTNKVKYVIM